MTNIQEPPPAQETYRVRDVLDDDRDPPKDFKHYMECDDEDEKQPSPM
ncbi:MAG TPA: hypothetical protein PLO43_02905 [Chlamydiales bacterium]|nr:hypothetical protein [Chlamydiales bacterium]